MIHVPLLFKLVKASLAALAILAKSWMSSTIDFECSYGHRGCVKVSELTWPAGPSAE